MVEPGWCIAGKIQLRLMWPLTVLLLLNSLDRVNVSYGALQMNKEIGLDASHYGLGVSCFFLGYILFQAPSVWALKRWGARRWLFGIVVAWGSVATAMAFIRTPTDFYIVRILLGFAESGFAPGVIYLAATWMPVRYRAAALATVMLAVPISLIVGGPICAWLMEQVNPMGLAGWRWMSLLEGSVTVVLAFACLAVFVDDPKDARWLSSTAKSWLQTELEREHPSSASGPRSRLSDLIGDPRIWLSAGAWFALLAGLYGVVFWLPLVLKQLTGGSALQISFIAATPWIASGLGSVINARHSDRTQERFWHCSLSLLLAAMGLGVAASTANSMIALTALILCGLGLGGAQSTIWTIPPKFLGRTNATIGVPLINMIGNSSGILAPYLIGAIRDRTGSFTTPVYALASLLLLGAIFTLLNWRIGERAQSASAVKFVGADR
jgi:MFS transporter, ACS family, tartrate transporter